MGHIYIIPPLMELNLLDPQTFIDRRLRGAQEFRISGFLWPHNIQPAQREASKKGSQSAGEHTVYISITALERVYKWYTNSIYKSFKGDL